MTEALFIVCVVLICVVALALAVWLIVTLVKGNRKDDAGRVVVVDDTAYVLVRVGDKAAVAQAAAEPASAEPAPVAQEPEEETAPVLPSAQEPEEEPCDEESEEEQEPQDMEGMITLRRNETLPYPEAYEALSSIEKSCVDDILAYAESKEGAKKVVNDKSASVYYGKKLLVRILLRRDKITARLTVQISTTHTMNNASVIFFHLSLNLPAPRADAQFPAHGHPFPLAASCASPNAECG